ncbi:MAG: dihydropteroate synthase [Bacteroidetes bacterium]|nr:dihydropteroate synthase [Bacteroidota bacterium]
MVMGILNITKDSFYDGGKHIQIADILAHTEKMLTEGAGIIDIGAVSTRPGANEIDEVQEMEIFKEFLPAIVKEFPQAIISVDTYRSNVAKYTIENGAHIINDISAGNFDNKMFETIAELKAPYIMMHIKGTPQNMQQNPIYTNLIGEIISYFQEKILKLKSLGVKDIIVDPGIGFGKTLDHNYEILSKLEMLKIFELPILMGVSRKSLIYKLLGGTPAEAQNGTTVLNTVSLLKGASILRVHDVKEAVEAIKIFSKLETF